MAETKAEDDDDESFGDFTFASFPSQFSVPSIHTNIQSSAGGGNDADDDEWGDFVKFPHGSELPSGPSHTQSQSQSSQPLDFFSNHTDDPSRVESVHNGEELGSNQWIKPKGALPLSLFGEEEEEEESRVVDPPSVGDLKEPFSNKHNGNVKKLSNFQYGTGIDDIIANLYGETKQIKRENESSSNLAESNLNFNGKSFEQRAVKLTTNASLSTPNHVRSNSDLVGNQKSDFFTNLYNPSEDITSENGFFSNANKLGWNSYASTPNLQGLNANGSSSNLRALHLDGSTPNLQDLSLNGSSSHLEGLNSNGLSSHLQVLNSKESSSNMEVLNSNGSFSNLQGLHLNEWSSNMKGLNFNGSSFDMQGLNVNGSSSNVQGSNTSGSNPNLQGLNPNVEGPDTNGSSLNLQGLNANGLNSNVQGLDAYGSNSNLLGLSPNGLSSNLQGPIANVSSSNFQGLSANGPSSSLKGFNSNKSSSTQINLSSSFNGWNLKSGSVGGNDELEAENGFSSNSNKLDSISNASNSNMTHLDWNLNGLRSNSTTVGGKEEFGNDEDYDDDDDGWEFKVANGSDFNSDSNKLDSSFNGSHLNSVSVNGNEKFDADDDDDWGFKDANSESKIKNENDKGPVAFELSGPKLESKWEIGREIQKDSGGPIDLFSDSNGVSHKPHEATEFDFKSAENLSLSYSNFQNDQIGMESRLDSRPPIQHADSDEGFGEFTVAFSEPESKHNEEPSFSNLSSSDVQVLAIDGENTVNENHKGAVPLSIFGEEELETNSSSNIQDDFTFKPVLSHRRSKSQGSSFTLNDIFDLYSQSQPINSVDECSQKNTENALDSTAEVMSNSNLMDIRNDLEDGSLELKDAIISPIITEEQINISMEIKMNTYADFYTKLRDELCSVARYHLDSLKKAQSSATLSGEDAKVAALQEEIREACEELHNEHIIYEESDPEDTRPRDISLKEFIQVLNEEEFQVLESEYHLSARLSMAEKDLRTAIELIKHSTTMPKIFKLVSLEEQSTYVSTWSKILSICAQELEHGASIWKQSLEKNVHTRIISEPQGKMFIIALGEIYRVVAILGLSVRLYRPWVLLSDSANSICNLLEECRTLWVSSGLEETLPTISHPLGFEYNGTTNMLLDSIKQIVGLDAFDLGNRVFSQQESLCRLSILPADVVPDMKLVSWNGEYYFVALANLWANLISCNPPKLPRFQQFGC